MHLSRIIESVVREDGARVLAGLIRLSGDFDAAEDALQDAFVRALDAWRRDGIPSNPGAWVYTVARRIALDRLRRDRSSELPADLRAGPQELEDPSPIEDDRLRLLFMCCHPALSPDARCSLALRSLGGLSTREIARAFVEPEATTAQRLVRAKRKIREARIPFELPPAHKLTERVDAVLSVIYLIFNEGYSSTESDSLLRPDLLAEAVRLARLTVELLPHETEARGLLALMLLTDARRSARLTAEGDIIPLEEQDRGLWNAAQIEEGTRLVDEALQRGTPGPYQIQAAISVLHATAASSEETDWRQIAALYRVLMRMSPTPIVELNAAVAEGFATSFDVALEWIARIEASGELKHYHWLYASKAEILRRLGRMREAAEACSAALAVVTSPADRRYIENRLSSLAV